MLIQTQLSLFEFHLLYFICLASKNFILCMICSMFLVAEGFFFRVLHAAMKNYVRRKKISPLSTRNKGDNEINISNC